MARRDAHTWRRGRTALAYALLVASAASLMTGLTAGGGPTVAAAAQEQDVPDTFGPRQAISKATCGPDDAPETGLQGRVPPADVASGRAFQPYTCNLELVGRFPSASFANFEAYGDCAYWGRAVAGGGVQVLDPWESLRVHAGRGLLVADSQVNGWFDVYDVSADCRQPQLISSTDMGLGSGHEGWFSPDGMTYWLSTTSLAGATTVRPVDLTDPAAPQVLAEWAFDDQTHGGWTTEDGTRSFICQQTEPPTDALHIVDTTEVQTRQPDPQPHVIATIPLVDNTWCQNAYRLTYDGHPHLVVFGERGGVTDCSRAGDGWASYAYPRFYDLANEANPVHVSDALLEVQLPEHCEEVDGEGVQVSDFGYSVHYCSPDRLYDPTILACSWFGSGLRVLDIRDPHNPLELAYYNPGIIESTSLGTIARPVIRAERGEIWFVTGDAGFHVLRFRDGVWPFAASPPCPEFQDLWFAHYNEGSTCPTATTDGVGQPAPEGPPPLPRDLQRLDGGGAADQVGQATDTSLRLFDDGGADRVVLATADTFADALAGAPLAGADAPILLTPGDGPLDPRVREEIARVTGGDGVVLTLGGTAAVAEDVAAEARAAAGDRPCTAPLPTSCRFAGATREATAALVADAVVAEHPDAPAVVLVARRDDPADALTGGAFAAAAGVPLLLTASGTAHPDAVAWLQRHQGRTAIALGGPASIADATLSVLPAVERMRVAGDERTATSAAVADQLWRGLLGAGRGGALLVNVRDDDAWPTALTGAVTAARLDMPQLGVEPPPAGLSEAVAAYMASVDGPLMVVGDPSLVSDDQLVEAGHARG